MELILLGIIIGLLIAILVLLTLTYFKSVVENKIAVVQKTIENAGPRPQGFIFEPYDDARESREEIIERNRAQGKDTYVEELI